MAITIEKTYYTRNGAPLVNEVHTNPADVVIFELSPMLPGDVTITEAAYNGLIATAEAVREQIRTDNAADVVAREAAYAANFSSAEAKLIVLGLTAAEVRSLRGP